MKKKVIAVLLLVLTAIATLGSSCEVERVNITLDPTDEAIWQSQPKHCRAKQTIAVGLYAQLAKCGSKSNLFVENNLDNDGTIISRQYTPAGDNVWIRVRENHIQPCNESCKEEDIGMYRIPDQDSDQIIKAFMQKDRIIRVEAPGWLPLSVMKIPEGSQPSHGLDFDDTA